MPRPNKQIDEIFALLEIATVNNSFLTALDEPTIAIRIEQAIKRYPELENLLRPALEELKTAKKKEYRARTAVSTAKSLIKKNFDK